MSASKSQEPSPSQFIYASRDPSVVLDCITVAAEPHDMGEDDDNGILPRSCEPQPVTGPVIFSTINWRPNPGSLTPPGPRVIELPDSGSGDEDEGHTKLLRNHKALSISPLSMPHQSLISRHEQQQQHQRIPIQTLATNYPTNLIGCSTVATEDNEDHYSERFAPSPGLPPSCPANVASPSAPHASASPTSSSTLSFCTCPPSPTPEMDQYDLIFEIQHICLSATQKFIRGYVSEERKCRRQRQQHAIKREGERATARKRARERKRKRPTTSHKDKVKKTSPVKPAIRIPHERPGGEFSGSFVSPTDPPPLNARKAQVHSQTDGERNSDSLSDDTSNTTTAAPNLPSPPRRIPTTSRKPTSPFSYAWMSCQMSSALDLIKMESQPFPYNGRLYYDEDNHEMSSGSSEPGPSAGCRCRGSLECDDADKNKEAGYDGDMDLDSDLDLNTIMTDSPSPSPSSSTLSGDEDLHLALQHHGLPCGGGAPTHIQPTIEDKNSGAKLNKNIDRVCSILWQRSLNHHRRHHRHQEQKRGILQDMALVLDLGAVLVDSFDHDQAVQQTGTVNTNVEGTATLKEQGPSSPLEKIADAAILLCKVLEDWEAVDQMESLDLGWWDFCAGEQGNEGKGGLV